MWLASVVASILLAITGFLVWKLITFLGTPVCRVFASAHRWLRAKLARSRIGE
jgi:hypothetical protein